MREDDYFYYWICNFAQKSSLFWIKEKIKFRDPVSRMEQFQKKILDHFSPSFLGQILFSDLFRFEGKNDGC